MWENIPKSPTLFLVLTFSYCQTGGWGNLRKRNCRADEIPVLRKSVVFYSCSTLCRVLVAVNKPTFLNRREVVSDTYHIPPAVRQGRRTATVKVFSEDVTGFWSTSDTEIIDQPTVRVDSLVLKCQAEFRPGSVFQDRPGIESNRGPALIGGRILHLLRIEQDDPASVFWIDRAGRTYQQTVLAE
jgi:hypothetical protein